MNLAGDPKHQARIKHLVRELLKRQHDTGDPLQLDLAACFPSSN